MRWTGPIRPAPSLGKPDFRGSSIRRWRNARRRDRAKELKRDAKERDAARMPSVAHKPLLLLSMRMSR